MSRKNNQAELYSYSLSINDDDDDDDHHHLFDDDNMFA